jgi:hypothetical protein
MSNYQKVKAVAVKINLQLPLYKKNRTLRLVVCKISKNGKTNCD